MGTMTSRERIARMFERREADRIPIVDQLWPSTLERWAREGLPDAIGWAEHLGLDRVRDLRVDNSPRYAEKTIEETPEYRIYSSSWGVTMKQWKHAASTPQFLDFTITDPASWATARARIDASPDRIDWKALEAEYPKWLREGAWIQATLWFGFDITHSWVVGTERVLMAMVEEPEWLKDMFEVELESSLRLLELVWDRGYRFHAVKWWDDMGYKLNQFFSVATYRDILKPFHRRAVEWAHDRGVKAYLHSCGDINPFLPELIEIGVDMLNPLEVKAGMDPYLLKRRYGDKLAFHGGMDALLYDDLPALHAEIERLIPAMKEGGGYIFGSDHSVPDSVGLEDFRLIVARAAELGRYSPAGD